MTTDNQWARAFRVTYPDGFQLHGVQFPSGRCIIDGHDSFAEGATAFEHLTLVKPLGVIEWADGGTTP